MEQKLLDSGEEKGQKVSQSIAKLEEKKETFPSEGIKVSAGEAGITLEKTKTPGFFAKAKKWIGGNLWFSKSPSREASSARLAGTPGPERKSPAVSTPASALTIPVGAPPEVSFATYAEVWNSLYGKEYPLSKDDVEFIGKGEDERTPHSIEDTENTLRQLFGNLIPSEIDSRLQTVRASLTLKI